MSPGPRIAVQVEEAQRGQISARWVRQVMGRFLEVQGRGENAAVSVAIGGDETLATLNQSFRGEPGPTDILSFRLDDPEHGGGGAFPRPPGTPAWQGELVISLPAVRRMASAEGRPWRQELAHLLAHGLLHLQGFDHTATAERADMERREEVLLTELLGPHRPFHVQT
ncbi:MAG: rRNA maturation RNase YbeY [Chloroflexi bacterium]|nr:rRNA maturation RNase YbeY [Chloroflexota bacterium]